MRASQIYLLRGKWEEASCLLHDAVLLLSTIDIRVFEAYRC